MFCMKCGKEINNEAIVCFNCGFEINKAPSVVDKPSIGLNILAFFFPIIGLILYGIWLNRTPIRANSIGKVALTSGIIGLILTAVTL